MSNLIAYAIYFVLIVLTVRFTLHAPTFTRQHFKILILIVLILNLNFLWQKYLPINNIWLSGKGPGGQRLQGCAKRERHCDEIRG